jgi:hypothetical protein
MNMPHRFISELSGDEITSLGNGFIHTDNSEL